MLLDPADELHTIFGDALHPLFIRADQPFWQHSAGGALSNQVSRKVLDANPELRFDSWLTIGATDNNENQTMIFLIDLIPFESEGAEISTTDGAWFCLPGQPQALAGKELRVLIGQFTTAGSISGQFSLMGRKASGEVFYEYDISFSSGD